MWLAVFSLWRRELIHFARQRSRIFGTVATPLLFWLLLGAGFGSSFQPGELTKDTSYLDYFFPGTIILIVLFTAIFSTMSVIEDRNAGFLQGVLASPAPRSAIVLGKVSGGTTVAMIQALMMLVLAPFAGVSFKLIPVLAAGFLLLPIAIGLTSLGLIIAWKMESTAGFHAIMNVLLIPMWLVSGAVFPVAHAHPIVKALIIANPLAYGLSAFRSLLNSGSMLSPTELGPTWFCTAITLAITALTVYAAVRIASGTGSWRAQPVPQVA